MPGRGAWPANGLGGTKKYKDETKAGSYYYLGTGVKPAGRNRNANEYAVHRAVIEYQAALNRRTGRRLTLDGIFGPVTSGVLFDWQEDNEAQTGTPWGGIGPESSKALLLPDLKAVVATRRKPGVGAAMVSGTINHESMWDVGAVGASDERDVGLGQINAAAHPEWTTEDRINPNFVFNFIIDYYVDSLRMFSGNIRDAIASYNLGHGGARRWISQGRPEWYVPSGQTKSRNVKKYIDSILAG